MATSLLARLGRILAAGLVAFLFALSANVARADGGHGNRLVVFGDSLSDPGNAYLLLKVLEVPPFANLIPDAPYAVGAFHFSNGPTWVEQLGLREHTLSAGPALLLPRIFTNYAVGGARARQDGNFHLGAQVGLFVLDFGGHAPGDALYVVFVGGNDLRDALGELAGPSYGAPAAAATLQSALAAIQSNVMTLYAAGARRFLIANAPDLGLTPAVRYLGKPAVDAAGQLAIEFNSSLDQILQGLRSAYGRDISIARFDVYKILNNAVRSPARVHLSNVTDPCIELATIVNPYCARPDTYLFWDGIHPTKAGHGILADGADAVLDRGVRPVALH